MVYISIPYVSENLRVDKTVFKNEIGILDISEDAKYYVYEAVFNLRPRGVEFKGADPGAIEQLQNTLRKLGIPYQRLEESDY